MYIAYIYIYIHAWNYFTALTPLVPQRILQPSKSKNEIKLIKHPTLIASL